jgi:hypothetical protein
MIKRLVLLGVSFFAIAMSMVLATYAAVLILSPVLGTIEAVFILALFYAIIGVVIVLTGQEQASVNAESSQQIPWALLLPVIEQGLFKFTRSLRVNPLILMGIAAITVTLFARRKD